MKRVVNSVILKISANLLIFLIVFSVFSVNTIAVSGDEDVIFESIDTVIIVNSGDISGIDAAIAGAISHDLGIPVYYTDHDEISSEVLEILKKDYPDLDEVVILGGEAVISSSVEQTLETTGVVSANFDVIRIGEPTATGTAVEAIEYLYGPEMVSEVTLVSYGGDSDRTYDDILHLASVTDGGPIIPVPDDVSGLPADVVETLEVVGIDNINIIGDFEQETEVKADLDEVNVEVVIEVDGDDVEELEEKVKDLVLENVRAGENVEIILVEEGDVPPVSTDENDLIVFYNDEDNNGIDDESGKELENIGKEIYDEISAEGATVEGIKFTGDNQEVLNEFKEGIDALGLPIQTEVGLADDVIKTTIEFNEDNEDEIEREFKEGKEEWENLAEAHKLEFSAALPSMLEIFKVYYVELKDKGELSLEALELGAKVIDEASKDDPIAAWRFMHAFASEERHEEYVENCYGVDSCRNEQTELEYADMDEKIEKLVGTERAREVANLDIGEKVGLLEVVDFVLPGQEVEFRADINEIIAGGASPAGLVEKYVDAQKEDVYKVYIDSLKKELIALGKVDEASALTLEQTKAKFDERLRIESVAYLSGAVKYDEFIDPTKRADEMAKFEAIAKEFEGKGIKDHYYMTHGDWKAYYDKYSKEGEFDDADFKKAEALTTTYRTWEKENPGTLEDPSSSFYDTKSGQFSFSDHEGRIVTGIYSPGTGKSSYTNEEGKLVQGDKEGRVTEYTKEQLPSGFKYDEKTGTYNDGKVTYIPPSQYNAFTGTYDFNLEGVHKEGEIVQCGSKGCSVGIYTGPGASFDPAAAGWKQSEDGKSWIATDGASYSITQYSSSGNTHTDASGVAWTQSSDGGWVSSTGEAHSGDAYYYTPPSGTTSGTTSGEGSGGGAYSGGTSGYTAPSGGYTGTTSGTETGGHTSSYSGSYSGGTTSSGGASGGGGTYSGGGDSGGGGYSSGGDSGGTGHVIAGYSIYDMRSGGRGLLTKWLR